MFRFQWLLLLGLTHLAYPADLSFNRDIRPILSDNCFYCHGTDPKNRKGDRRLDTFEGAAAEKDGVRAIVPGSLAKSELWTRINAPDADDVMPPPKTHKTLTPVQKDKLRRWIEAGAKYEKHWSFVPLAAATVPKMKDLGVRDAAWAASTNPIDAFIAQRFVAEGLQPSPAAAPETLIRRLSLDLTGLPPSIAEVDAFMAESSRHPDSAISNLVDRLLASSHYGERMAVDWLDAARFADSNGYQVDRDREMWPWRDWVIKAFNDNKRFDQFTIEQLAGDLLPEATMEQRIATGFHRNHMLNEEGGIIAEEFLAEYTADRVETTAAVWLGQTFNCCRCHDHKFDPFTQRDFYALKAFFHNVPERGVGIYSNPIRQNSPPFVKLPAPEIERRLDGLNVELKGVNDKLTTLADKSSAGTEEWAQQVARTSLKWTAVALVSPSGGDQPPHLDAATRTLEVGPQETRANTIKVTARLPRGKVTALRFEAATTAPAASFQWSELKVFQAVKGKDKKAPLKLRAIAAGDSLAASETMKVLDNDRKTRAMLSIKPEKPAVGVFELEPALAVSDPDADLDIEIGVENAGGPSRWRVMVCSADPQMLVPAAVLTVARKDAAKRTQAEVKQIKDHHLTQQVAHRQLSDELEKLKKQVATAEGEIPTTLVMEEMKEPRPTFVLMRGAYDKPGGRVTAATPAVLPAPDASLPHNRLGLARWLVSPANPLPARVTVNRLWQQVFGTGLVKTSEDFGAQGAPPSHPELLDWLAGEFIRSGWDVKHLMKLMVTSATYGQQSRQTPLLHEKDPDNVLLARAPRFRLMGEFVRDQALAAGGLLVDRIGGPSVKPYHPPGIYEQITAGNGYNTYVPGKGEDLHRRSLYTYWKRSVPNPAMMLFDAPFREACTLRRPRTNTPLQALNLMNDPTFVEASRFLAQRMILEGGTAADSRLAHGFRLLLARTPKPSELAVLRSSYERARSDFAKDPEAAKALLAVGEAGLDASLNTAELAAFTTVASTLLNLDEAITKE